MVKIEAKFEASSLGSDVKFKVKIRAKLYLPIWLEDIKSRSRALHQTSYNPYNPWVHRYVGTYPTSQNL